MIFKKFIEALKTGWAFFFRWPVFSTHEFVPSGILFGAFWQAVVIGVASFFLYALCRYVGQIGSASLWLGLENIYGLQYFGASVVLAILTGFFHEDGLADTADAFGVPKYASTPEVLQKISQALKDSRLGSYGVCALILLWLLRYSFSGRVPEGAWLLPSAVIFCSRGFALSMGVFLARQGYFVQGSQLAQVLRGVRKIYVFILFTTVLFIHFLIALFYKSYSIFYSIIFSLIAFGLGLSITWALLRKFFKHVESFNGDMIGATVCCLEVFFWLLFV